MYKKKVNTLISLDTSFSNCTDAGRVINEDDGYFYDQGVRYSNIRTLASQQHELFLRRILFKQHRFNTDNAHTTGNNSRIKDIEKMHFS